MKDWTTVTAGEIVVGDIISAPLSSGHDSTAAYTVSGIGRNEKTGGPLIHLKGARPITPNSNDIIEVYR